MDTDNIRHDFIGLIDGFCIKATLVLLTKKHGNQRGCLRVRFLPLASIENILYIERLAKPAEKEEKTEGVLEEDITHNNKWKFTRCHYATYDAA